MKNIQNLVKESNLKHIAIIMDGNRRWAKEKGLPTPIGHKKGADALKKILIACNTLGIKYLTVYAFSTENWNRKPEEVNFLMDLLCETIKNELDEMHQNNVVIKFIGNRLKLSDKIQNVLKHAEDTTKNNNGVNLQIAFNYGSRDEIVNAVQKIIDSKNKIVTEELISENLYTGSIPDPDLLIRTGGEMRVSNYLLWQIAYSEIIVIPEFWPDFDETKLSECITEFANRNRRWGK